MNTYNIIITGKVQDISFRSIIENIGRSFGMPGFVFNAKDGSVKILCSGDENVIDNFTQTIKLRGAESGAEIVDITEQLLPPIDLPYNFSKASSDDDIDIGRKLDKANLLLKSVNTDINIGFNNLNTDLKTGFNNLNTDLKTGFNNLNTDLNTGFNNLNTDLKTGFNNLNTDLNTGFNNLNTDLNTGFSNLNDMLGSFIGEQSLYNRGQQEHNARLTSILEKLVEKK